MSENSSQEDRQTLCTERFRQVLGELSEKGINQIQVGARTGMPPQYISDVKSGTRNVSELFARRISQEFGYDYLWLRGEGSSPQPRPALPPSDGKRIVLPLLPHPVKGIPEEFPHWDGAVIEVCGVAVIAAKKAEKPYVLKYDRTDPQGLLHKGDLLLISQKTSEQATIGVVGANGKYFLSRRNQAGQWERVAPGILPAKGKLIGHCVGILWRNLMAKEGQ